MVMVMVMEESEKGRGLSHLKAMKHKCVLEFHMELGRQ